MIENRLLQYFLVIAREQNMTNAAKQLHISQPALSKQMSQLEEQLGVTLFKRTNKSTTLTEEGVLFRSRAQEMIDLMNKMEAEFLAGQEDISGDIYLGCGETCIMRAISKVLREIQIEFPNIHFHIFSGDAQTVLERMDKGLIDACLLLGPILQEKYDYQKLSFYDSFGVLLPKDSPLANKEVLHLKDILDVPMLIPAQTYSGFQALNWNQDFLKQLNMVGTYNLVTNATYMVEEGIGYALTLDYLVNTTGRNLTFIRLEPELKIDAYIVTKKYAMVSKAAKLFIEKIKQFD